MARRKILVAMMMHETNTFSPVPTPLASFRPLSGPAAVQEFQDTNTQLGGFLHVAKETGAEIVVPLAAGAHPSGYAERAAYEDMCEAIVGGIRNGCDAAFLALHGAMVAGFPHAYIPHLSCSAVIVCDRQGDPGKVLLDQLLGLAWERRDSFLYRGEPLSSQIAHARSLGEGPILLVDHGDNTASGGTQDVMSVIEEVTRQGLEDVVAGPICDPPSIARILAAGTAASVTLSLGGKVDMPQVNLTGKPLSVTGKVARITEGEFVVTGPMATGTRVRMGRTAVLDTGAMEIVVSDRRSEQFDLGVFTHCSIDPRRKRYVLIKSRQHFRAGFEPIARHIVLCDGEGVTSSDLKLFKYTKIRRPLYPFDPDMRLVRNG